LQTQCGAIAHALKSIVYMNNNNNHIQLDDVNTDEIIRISACMADTILKPLYDYVSERNLHGYIGTLDIICQWAKEFYQQYYSKMKEWDSFEESEDNIYNSMCWDDFLIDWTNERFKKFKDDNEQIAFIESSERQFFGSSKTPKLIIVIKHHNLSAVYSNIPIEFAQINYDDANIASCPVVGVFDADTIAQDLITLFDQNDPQQQAIQEELINQGF
jgi:hypothetical protein